MRVDYCDSCGAPTRAEYTVYRVTKSGRRAERRLCATCAGRHEKIRLGETGLPLVDLLAVLTSRNSDAQGEEERTKVCPSCGNTSEDVTEAGMVGCSTCYTALRAEVDRMIERLHGRPGKAG